LRVFVATREQSSPRIHRLRLAMPEASLRWRNGLNLRGTGDSAPGLPKCDRVFAGADLRRRILIDGWVSNAEGEWPGIGGYRG